MVETTGTGRVYRTGQGERMKIPYTARGLTLDCVFELESGEPATWDEPGWPDVYHLISASVQGVDVTAIIDPALVHQLEERAGWS